MKRIVSAGLFVCLILASCDITLGDPGSTNHYTSANLTYTISGAGSLATANIKYVDSSGNTVSVANASLPASYNIPAYTYTKPYVWAQNVSSDFSSALTVSISKDGISKTSKSATGLYCIAEADIYIEYY